MNIAPKKKILLQFNDKKTGETKYEYDCSSLTYEEQLRAIEKFNDDKENLVGKIVKE